MVVAADRCDPPFDRDLAIEKLDRVWSKYQKTRGASRYDEVLESCGMRRTGFLPYRFRHSPAGFHTFVKDG